MYRCDDRTVLEDLQKKVKQSGPRSTFFELLAILIRIAKTMGFLCSGC